MPRYVAFLRGVSPMNAKMPELRRCFETGGFADVRTVLSSGNVVFTSPASPPDVLERQAEEAMRAELGHSFGTFVRSAESLQRLIAANPFAPFELPPTAKRVVTFLRRSSEPPAVLPLERDGASILRMAGAEVFTAYVPGEKGPAFMTLLERTFGKDITTRMLDTVVRCARA